MTAKIRCAMGEPHSAPVQRGKSAHRLLAVKDEPDIRRLRAEVPTSFGYKVDTAEDGMAGWMTLRAVRYAPASDALLITGRLIPEDLFTRNLWLQPVAVLVKPYLVEQRLETVEAVLRTADGAREPIASPPNWLSAGSLRYDDFVSAPASSAGSSGSGTWAGLASLNLVYVKHRIPPVGHPGLLSDHERN